MAFVPRTFEQIRDDMIAYVRLYTDLTDFEVGSVVRTILESAAMEDDEQYFQMVQLLDAFRLSTAASSDLDDRVAEFGFVRLQTVAAAGEVTFTDEAMPTSFLTTDVIAGATSMVLDDTSAFPTTGYPYTVRFGEGTVAVEDLTVSGNNTTTNTLTHGAAVFNHQLGDRGSYVSGSSDRTLNPGIRVQVPSTNSSVALNFVTTETGSHVNGNYFSTSIRARAEVPGSGSNIGSANITDFTSSAPFEGAGVTNLSSFGGGRDLETDAELRDRARAGIQSLSRGTVLALKVGVIGVADPVTGQSVTTSNILEDLSADEVIVYVDDGTGFTPDTVELARSTLSAGILAGVSALAVTDASNFPAEGFVMLSPENLSQLEMAEYVGVNYTTNTLTLAGPTDNAHDINDEVAVVDVITNDAEAGQNFFRTRTYPLVRSSDRVWVRSGAGGSFTLQVADDDFILNRGTGVLEILGAGLASGSAVVVNYTYYTGLLALVQKVIDGDPDDSVSYPGIRAAGIRVLAETPTIRRISAQISITAKAGYDVSELAAQAQEACESYVSSLGIGEDVIRAEFIERSMGVTGVYNCLVHDPVSDVVILENELPVPHSSSGVSLIVVN